MSCSGLEFDIVELLIPCDLVKAAGERKGYERLLGSVLVRPIDRFVKRIKRGVLVERLLAVGRLNSPGA